MGETLLLRIINVDIINQHVVTDRIRLKKLIEKTDFFNEFQACMTVASGRSPKIFILEAINHDIISETFLIERDTT